MVDRCSEQTEGSVFHNACVAAHYPETAVFAISWNTTKLINITTQGDRCKLEFYLAHGELCTYVPNWLVAGRVVG